MIKSNVFHFRRHSASKTYSEKNLWRKNLELNLQKHLMAVLRILMTVILILTVHHVINYAKAVINAIQ